MANEELTREEKKEQIKEVKKQAHNRRMQILTEEQQEKLRQWRADHRAEHQQQFVNGNSGRPQGNNGGRGQEGRGGQEGRRHQEGLRRRRGG